MVPFVLSQYIYLKKQRFSNLTIFERPQYAVCYICILRSDVNTRYILLNVVCATLLKKVQVIILEIVVPSTNTIIFHVD